MFVLLQVSKNIASKDSSVSSSLQYVFAMLNIFVRTLACLNTRLNQGLKSMPMHNRQSKCICHPEPYARRKTYLYVHTYV
jgi:hypothetical protein